MSSPFVAEVRIFPFNFPPKGWALCDGQIMPISQNTALFSLLGTTYGGNGISNFALPNLQGSVPMHPGQGPGLTSRLLGETGGEDTVTLFQSEMPLHTHAVNAVGVLATAQSPAPNMSLARSRTIKAYSTADQPVSMNSQSLAVSGGSLPHNNLMPYLTLNFCIALQGIFPARA